MDTVATKLLLTRREAGEALGVSVDMIARLIQRGELRHVRIGRSVLIPEVDLRTLIERLAGSARADIPGLGPDDEPADGAGGRR
jgi:excisionase family DNA binding protein